MAPPAARRSQGWGRSCGNLWCVCVEVVCVKWLLYLILCLCLCLMLWMVSRLVLCLMLCLVLHCLCPIVVCARCLACMLIVFGLGFWLGAGWLPSAAGCH